MVTIVPSLLAKDSATFESQLKKVWGIVPRVQMDIIDGKFDTNTTVMPEILNEIDTIVEFDAHLMVQRPEDWIERCAQVGIIAVYGQVEMMDDKTKFVADAQAAGMRAGLAYDIDTPLDGLEEIIEDLDAVLLMSVKAGAQERDFDERVLEKIKKVREMSKKVTIIVDGGLNLENIKKCLISEWAEEIAEDEWNKSFMGIEFAIGSDILQAENPAEEIKKLESLGAVS